MLELCLEILDFRIDLADLVGQRLTDHREGRRLPGGSQGVTDETPLQLAAAVRAEPPVAVARVDQHIAWLSLSKSLTQKGRRVDGVPGSCAA